MGKFVVSGMGPDKPGIVSGLTQVLYQFGCNIEDSTMTNLVQEFAMILLVDCPGAVSLDEMKKAFLKVESDLGLSIFVKELSPHPTQSPHQEDFIPVMISVCGEDRTGITYEVAQLLANHQVNITDLNAQTILGETGPVYILMIEAQLFTSSNRPLIELELQKLAERLSIEIKLNSIDPITL
ncbi:MAG: amino acid-binding protein [Cyanobacteria bacterium]|nr:amino acid-binding protein [Cyanobacteriota bacterium]